MPMPSYEKPFQCRFCGRRYARKDLVTRHEKSFHPNADIPIAACVEVENASKTETPPDLQASTDHPVTPVSASPVDSSMEMDPDTFLVSNKTPSVAGSEQSSRSLRSRNSDAGPLPFQLGSDRRPSVANSYDHHQQTIMATPPTTLVGEPMNHEFAWEGSRSGSGSGSGCIATTSQSQPSQETSAYTGEHPDFSEFLPWFATDIGEATWSGINHSRGGSIANADFSNQHRLNAPEENGDQFDAFFSHVDLLQNGANFGTDPATYMVDSSSSAPLEMAKDHSDQAECMSSWPPESTAITATATTIDQAASSHTHMDAKSAAFANQGSFSRMPSIMAQTPRKLTIPSLDAATYDAIVASIESKVPPELWENTGIPSHHDLQRFMPSLDPSNSPHHLILAICSVGALYRLIRKKARDMWSWANFLADTETNSSSADIMSRPAVALVQTKLLLGSFAILNGDMMEQALKKVGCWCLEYRVRRCALALRPHSPSTTYEEWVLRETSKRILYSMFIMSSLMTVIYDLCPVFGVTQDLDIEILDAECLWEAANKEQWESFRRSQRAQSPRFTIRDALAHLIHGKEQMAVDGQPVKWSGFATAMVFHAVNVHNWNVMQSTQSLTAFAVDEQNNKTLKAALVSQVDVSLARCYALVTADRAERERSSDDPEGPLMFNCIALLRSAYVRVFTGAGSFNRMMLLGGNPAQVAGEIQAFLSSSQERSLLVTRAAEMAYGGLLTPVKAGYILVQKTAALTWSIEHAVAAWDCALFVSKWVHEMEMQQRNVPPNADEMRILLNFRKLLEEVDSSYDGSGSMAAEISRTWAGFLDDTWVWGITPMMGQVLRQLSAAFAKDWAKNFPLGNVDGPLRAG
ncbi:uncharacterized protein L3040_009315 [Drepanopeziza brunnea f. sp. 'multigermtubi']|uniref:uncharacterized protein n=1 Tax=Drepanopeziza brunnea f. sp. 'multigermtubi' TaxID=698441 RepID=UPI002392C27C|nr:hypothetical protein L3040_009315 [Drepanopeziza brunnea f. sp. 'multigermtubi']